MVFSKGPIEGLWTSVTMYDLNARWRRSEVPLMYGTEAYILLYFKMIIPEQENTIFDSIDILFYKTAG